MINGYTEEEWIEILDDDISRIKHNQNFKITMLEKQNTSPDRMKIFISEMKASEKHLRRLRRFAYYKLIIRKYKSFKQNLR